MDFLIDPIFYNWLILTVVLLIIEVAFFTLLFFWIAIATIIMAGISFVYPQMSITAQLFCFSIIAILSVIIWHRTFINKQNQIGDRKINNRAQRHVGSFAILYEDIINGRGKVKIADSYWCVSCSIDLPKGTKVEIIDANGTILRVKPS